MPLSLHLFREEKYMRSIELEGNDTKVLSRINPPQSFLPCVLGGFMFVYSLCRSIPEARLADRSQNTLKMESSIALL